MAVLHLGDPVRVRGLARGSMLGGELRGSPTGRPPALSASSPVALQLPGSLAPPTGYSQLERRSQGDQVSAGVENQMRGQGRQSLLGYTAVPTSKPSLSLAWGMAMQLPGLPSACVSLPAPQDQATREVRVWP